MTRAGAALALCLLVPACSSGRETAVAPDPPSTRTVPVAETLHGIEIRDPYRWLEETSAEVAQWSDAQNRYTRHVLDPLPNRGVVEARLKALTRLGSVTAPVMSGNRFFSARRRVAQGHGVLVVRDGSLGAERPLVDPVELDPTGQTTLAWFSPSAGGTLLAYGTARDGEPVSTLRLLDVDRMQHASLQISNVLQAPQWAGASGFVYERLRDADNPHSREGRFHRLGTDPSSDAVLYRQVARKQTEQLAQSDGPSASLSQDGRWIVLSYWLNPYANDVWVARFDEFLRKGSAAARVVTVGVPGTAVGTVIDDTLFLHTTKGAPQGRVVAADVRLPDARHWRQVVPERADATIQSIAFGRGTLAVSYLKDASTSIEVFELSGRSRGTLRQPGLGDVSISTREDRTEAYLTFTSFVHPPTVFRVDLANPAAAPTYWSGPETRVDSSLAEVHQVSYSSRDGTSITMFLVHRKNLAKTGAAPTVLTGHGAFGVRMQPQFWGPFFHWVEEGGILAIPHLRGGGEHGERWHEAGMLHRKRNTIDDFVAAAEWLVANKYTNADRLAVHGITNGALAAAAAVIERPELFKAAVLVRPLGDMLRYHRFSPAPRLVAEYGSPEDPNSFKALFGYSPYHRIRPGTRYPALLITGAEEDPEVPSLHARKLAAALQTATVSDRSQRPVLLRIDRPVDDDAALLQLELRDLTDQQQFLRWQLGVR